MLWRRSGLASNDYTWVEIGFDVCLAISMCETYGFAFGVTIKFASEDVFFGFRSRTDIALGN